MKIKWKYDNTNIKCHEYSHASYKMVSNTILTMSLNKLGTLSRHKDEKPSYSCCTYLPKQVKFLRSKLKCAMLATNNYVHNFLQNKFLLKWKECIFNKYFNEMQSIFMIVSEYLNVYKS